MYLKASTGVKNLDFLRKMGDEAVDHELDLLKKYFMHFITYGTFCIGI